ncbi:microtubule-associated protein 4 isoform X5 [Limanda limanda]|uniref:microtubule-associated protein 4 isoform X5 n=1 Tax=Limanda limanda TaxID=27771 RepID=UPI0029C7A492|nr:microtubule-associated protein 4 isoform X5 [Limanda limanda]
MAELDLSLSDALADAPQTGQVESLVERDFMAQLEAETFDDKVGETVGKTDYIPLLDNVDTRADTGSAVENGEQEARGVQKPGCKLTSGGQITASRPEPQGEVRPLPLDQKQAVATDFLSASMAGYIDHLDSQSSPAQIMDTGLMGAFSGFSQPGGNGVKVEVGAATLQADRPPSIAEPQHATPPAGLEAPKEHGPMLPEPQVPRSPADLTAVKSEKKEENLEDSVKQIGHFEPLNKADERGVKVEYESTETPVKVEKEMEKETQKDTEKEKEVKIGKEDEKVKVTEGEKVKAADKQAEKVEEMKKEPEKGKEKETEKVESMQQKEDKMTKAEESLDKSVKIEKVEKVENKAEKIENVEKMDESEKVKVTEKSENKNIEKLEKTAMKDDKEHIDKVEKTPEPQSTALKFDTSYDKLEKEADRETKATEVVEETKKDKADVDKAQKMEKEGEPEKPSDKPAEQPEQKSEKQEKQDQIQAENETVEKKDDKKDKAVKADSGEKAKKLKPLANGSSTTPNKDLAGADKKTKPGAGLTKPSAAARMRPSSAIASSGSLAAPIKRPTPSSITSISDKKATTARAPSTPTAGLKRPSTGPASRPLSSTTTTATRDVRPKTTIERRPLVPKASTATSNQTGPTTATKNGTATTAASKTTTSVRTTLTARTSATAPKKPLVPKTNSKPGEEKKPSTLRTSAADSTKPKTTTRSAGAPTTTTASRTRIAAAKPAAPSSSTVPEKKPTVPRAPRAAFSTSATAASKTATRPSTAPAADTRNVRSKIGSTDNMKHQPGGGKVSASQIRAVASKDTSQGKVQILNKKVDLSKVTSKCGSKDNIKYKPGGGDVKIGSHKVNFREKAQSKAGSTDNLSNSPGGGNIKAEGVQETPEGNETPLSGTQAPAPSLETGEAVDLPAHENGLKDGAPCESESLREPQALDSSIPETSI